MRWGRWLLGFGSNDRQVAHAAKACQHGGLLAFKQPYWHSTLYFHKSAALQKILKPEHTRQPVRHTIRLCYASLVVPYSVCFCLFLHHSWSAAGQDSCSCSTVWAQPADQHMPGSCLASSCLTAASTIPPHPKHSSQTHQSAAGHGSCSCSIVCPASKPGCFLANSCLTS